MRVFVCHHHLVPVPGTGRERNQVLDAGDVLTLLRQCEVDLVLSGHRHVPYVWPIAGMLLVHSGTVSTLRTRGFPNLAYNLIVEAGRISVDLCVPRGEQQSLGDYPRDWPPELSPATPTHSCAPNAESRWRRMRRQHPGRDAG